MIELTTAVMLFVSAFYGGQSFAQGPDYASRVEEAKPLTLEMHVKEVYKDDPVLIDIARCESRFRHLNKRGEVLRGEQNIQDIGVMQINELYHAERSVRLGFNIHNLEDNLGYAKWLYLKEGTRPWNASKRCWNKSPHVAKR